MTKTTTPKTAAEWLAVRAAQVLAGADLALFLALPLKSQAVGIATFTKLAEDKAVRDVAMKIVEGL